MRHARYWFVGVLVLALLVAGSVAFFERYLKLSRAATVFHPNTGIVRDDNDANWCQFPTRDGQIVLKIERGERGNRLFDTSHGWAEDIAIECPQPEAGTRIDVGEPNTQVYLLAHLDMRVRYRFDTNGVRGYVEFEEVTERRITARYEIIVTVFSPQLIPSLQHQEKVFQGRDVFRRQSAPEGKRFGELWPPPAPAKK